MSPINPENNIKIEGTSIKVKDEKNEIQEKIVPKEIFQKITTYLEQEEKGELRLVSKNLKITVNKTKYDIGKSLKKINKLIEKNLVKEEFLDKKDEKLHKDISEECTKIINTHNEEILEANDLNEIKNAIIKVRESLVDNLIKIPKNELKELADNLEKQKNLPPLLDNLPFLIRMKIRLNEINEIVNPSEKSAKMNLLVDSFVEKGMLEKAFNLAVLIPTEYLQERILKELIKPYLDRDMGNKLLDMLDKISNPQAKYEVSKELAREFLRRDMPDDALKAKEKIPEGYETDSTIVEIVRKYVKLGRVDDAEKLASQITNSLSKKVALKAINNAK